MQFLIVLAALLAASDATPTAPTTEVWAGHEILDGKRKIPVYGMKDTHTENFVLAHVRREGFHLHITQEICRLDIRAIKGVTPVMRPEAVAAMPKTSIDLDVAPNGSLMASPWTSQWGSEDLDHDGHPGISVQITGGSCTGDLFVSNQATTSLANGHLTGDGATGTLTSHLRQKVLGAKGFCLRLMAGDSEETKSGPVAYRRVDPHTTCQSLAGKPWPVKAQPAK